MQSKPASKHAFHASYLLIGSSACCPRFQSLAFTQRGLFESDSTTVISSHVQAAGPSGSPNKTSQVHGSPRRHAAVTESPKKSALKRSPKHDTTRTPQQSRATGTQNSQERTQPSVKGKARPSAEDVDLPPEPPLFDPPSDNVSDSHLTSPNKRKRPLGSHLSPSNANGPEDDDQDPSTSRPKKPRRTAGDQGDLDDTGVDLQVDNTRRDTSPGGDGEGLSAEEVEDPPKRSKPKLSKPGKRKGVTTKSFSQLMDECKDSLSTLGSQGSVPAVQPWTMSSH